MQCITLVYNTFMWNKATTIMQIMIKPVCDEAIVNTLVSVHSPPQEICYNEVWTPSISWTASGIDWGVERVVIEKVCFRDIVVQDDAKTVWCSSVERCKNHCEHQAKVLVMINCTACHHVTCALIGTSRKLAALWTTLEYMLVDANRVFQGIQKVRVEPATRSAVATWH